MACAELTSSISQVVINGLLLYTKVTKKACYLAVCEGSMLGGHIYAGGVGVVE